MTTTTSRDAELFPEVVADVAKMAAACGVPPDWRRMWFDAETELDDLRTALDAELTRLRAIETAAREVLARGQARYTVINDEWGDERDEYVGDLVPAAAMIALAEAVHGATMSTRKPPAASDEYARGLEAAQFAGAGEVHGGD